MKQNNGVSRQELGEIYEAYAHFFPEGVVNQKDTPSGRWKTKKAFIDFIGEKTGVDIRSGNPNLIKKSQSALEKIAVDAKGVEANRPTNEQLAAGAELAEENKAAWNKARADAKATVEAGIKKQQELHKSLEGKTIHAQIKRRERPPTPEEIKADEIAAELKAKVELKPGQTPLDRQKQVAAVAAKIIEERVTPVLEKDFTKEEIRFRSEQTAIKLAEALENPQVIEKYTSFTEKTAVLEAIATNTRIVPEGGQVAAGNIAAIRSMSIEGDRAMAVTAFGDGFGKFFGLPSSAFDISLSESPIRGGIDVDMEQVSNQYGQILSQQSSIIDSVSGFAQGQARDFIFKQFSSAIGDKIATGASNEVIKGILSGVGGGSVTISVDSAFLTNFAANIPGGMNVITGIGNLFGINIVSGGAAGAVGGAVATAGTEAIAGAAGSAVAAGAAEAVAATVPVAGWIVAAVIAIGKKVVGWIKDKLPAIKRFLRKNGGAIGLMLFGGGFLTGSVLLGAIGIPFFFGGVATSASLAAFGAGVGSFFVALGGSILGAIGMPILITLLTFPVIVALILFIINSGAYVVPPREGLDAPFGAPISCSDEKGPVGISNNASSPIAKRAWEITYDLYQGFWCFWNRSPHQGPTADFPNDHATYPPSYPELFNLDRFRRDPNSDGSSYSNCGDCMFWCTWLVQKAFRESGNSSLQDTLWAPSMQDDFIKRGKYISASEATFNGRPENRVLSGSVIFFNVVGGPLRTNHVGIVHSVNSDAVVYVQSNAPTKDDFVPFNKNTPGVQSPGGLNVVGFGLP